MSASAFVFESTWQARLVSFMKAQVFTVRRGHQTRIRYGSTRRRCKAVLISLGYNRACGNMRGRRQALWSHGSEGKHARTGCAELMCPCRAQDGNWLGTPARPFLAIAVCVRGVVFGHRKILALFLANVSWLYRRVHACCLLVTCDPSRRGDVVWCGQWHFTPSGITSRLPRG